MSFTTWRDGKGGIPVAHMKWGGRNVNNYNEIKYLFDVESVPDARLIKMVKYPGIDIDEHEAVKRLKNLTNSEDRRIYSRDVSVSRRGMWPNSGGFQSCRCGLLDKPRFRRANDAAFLAWR